MTTVGVSLEFDRYKWRLSTVPRQNKKMVGAQPDKKKE
jgi:hypothetical protein